MNDTVESEKRVGTVLCGKWTLERLLGIGGMAAVFVGTHKIGRRVAIKVLHSHVARSPELRARFVQEAHVANRFHHPGAVAIRDIDTTEDGAPFLVMELLEGETLAERFRRDRTIEPNLMLRLVHELLDVLAAAHAHGIVHRDIKLDNLFVQQSGQLKVLDFGIARVRDSVPGRPLTRTGAALGTLPYMAPEQAKGAEIDARVDIFAVGATMFRLVAKRRLHEADSEGEMLFKMATQMAPPLASVAPDASAGLCLVVDRALQFDRERRYPDAITMQGDVQALRDGEPPKYASALAATLSAIDVRPDAHGSSAAPDRDAHTMTAAPRRSGPPQAPSSPPIVKKDEVPAVPPPALPRTEPLVRSAQPLPPRTELLSPFAPSPGPPAVAPPSSAPSFEPHGAQQPYTPPPALPHGAIASLYGAAPAPPMHVAHSVPPMHGVPSAAPGSFVPQPPRAPSSGARTLSPAWIILIVLVGVIVVGVGGCIVCVGIGAARRHTHVEVTCDAGGDRDRVACLVRHTAGERRANACWTLRVTCANGVQPTGQVCQTISPKARATRNVPMSELKSGGACDVRTRVTVEGVKSTPL